MTKLDRAGLGTAEKESFIFMQSNHQRRQVIIYLRFDHFKLTDRMNMVTNKKREGILTLKLLFVTSF